MARSATERTLKYLRSRGYQCAMGEYWNPFAGARVKGQCSVCKTFVPHPVGQRKDTFGFVDVWAVRPDKVGMVCVQSTSGTGNLQKRVQKILEIPVARTILQAHNRIYVFGWRKLKSGWAPKIVEVVTDNDALIESETMLGVDL